MTGGGVTTCRLCGATEPRELLDLGSHPIAHHFLRDPGASEYTHPVSVAVCDACALIQLLDPVPPELLYSEYVTLSSWKHQPHVPRLLELLADERRLDTGASVLEIGSNDGGFLEALRAAGYSRLLGVEPAEDARAGAAERGVPTIGEYFDSRLARRLVDEHGRFDLFVARQVLEHIERLDELGAAMRGALAPGALVLVEVPNFGFALETRDYSAIWEEHVNYFTLETLSHYLESVGVRILHSETALFSGEILIVLGEYTGAPGASGPGAHVPDSVETANRYAREWPATRSRLAAELGEHRDGGGRIAVYGAGCRACSLINYAEIAPYVDFVVDDQPEKQRLFMPGSRLPILPSDALVSEGIDLCLLAVNAENEERVIARHDRFREGGGRFASLHPPSERLVAPLRPVHA
jgi:SAM-dependent methyltransferase